MNWDKAKNLAIVFLVIVNAFLGVLIIYSNDKYNLTQAQEDAISRFMSQNKVSLYTTIPKEFKPKSQIKVMPQSFNMDELVAAFFGTTSNVEPNFQGGKSVYTHDNFRLIVEGDTFTFDNLSSAETFAFTRDTAISYCNAFIQKNKNLFRDFTFDLAKETKDGFLLTYCGKFNNFLITSNELTFYISKSGMIKAECTYNKPVSFDGAPKEIISADEALYIFVKNMNYIYGEQEIFLDSMDLVYFQGQSSTDLSIPLKATPYYRFFVFSGDAQILVNAYTGAVYDTNF